jgi:hypothetical protein
MLEVIAANVLHLLPTGITDGIPQRTDNQRMLPTSKRSLAF